MENQQVPCACVRTFMPNYLYRLKFNHAWTQTQAPRRVTIPKHTQRSTKNCATYSE